MYAIYVYVIPLETVSIVLMLDSRKGDFCFCDDSKNNIPYENEFLAVI